jgi:hypothetical protein
MCQCPVCREAAENARLERESREMTLVAIAWIAEHHGLDDRDAWRHLRLHAFDGTGVMQ